jgi:hypothetical protein
VPNLLGRRHEINAPPAPLLAPTLGPARATKSHNEFSLTKANAEELLGRTALAAPTRTLPGPLLHNGGGKGITRQPTRN